MQRFKGFRDLATFGMLVASTFGCREEASTTSAVFGQNLTIYHYAINNVQVRIGKNAVPGNGTLSLSDPKAATLLALWEVTSLKPDQPNVNSSGIAIDNATLTPDGADSYILRFSARFSILNVPPSEFANYRFLSEYSHESAKKAFREAPTCFRYYLESFLGLRLGQTIDVAQHIDKVDSRLFQFSYQGDCSEADREKYKNIFSMTKVNFVKAEKSNSSVAPDLKRLTADGELSFYLMFVNDKFVLPPVETTPVRQSEGSSANQPGPTPPSITVSNTEDIAPNAGAPSGSGFELLDIQDTLVKEMNEYFAQRFGMKPKMQEPGFYEYTSDRIVPGVKTKLVVHQIVDRLQLTKAIDRLGKEIQKIDVLSYNGHAGMGNAEIFEFFNANSAALRDYKVLAMNACWTSSFFMRRVAPGAAQNFDFIGHSETIVFDTFPMLNRMLFDTVIEKRTYQDFVDRSTKGVGTEKGGSLERTRTAYLKSGRPLEDLLPGTIVFERSDAR